MGKNLFLKLFWTLRTYEEKCDLLSKKKHKHFLLQDHQLAEKLIFDLGFFEKKKRDKSIFVTKFLGTIITVTFI